MISEPPVYRPLLHYYGVLLAVCTLILLFIGGMVTSTGSGLSVPDWPTTFGRNMFTFPPSMMKGGIFYEHGHRLAASLVGLLTIGNCLLLWAWEKRSWLRYAGLAALAMVILQGVLGGLTVRMRLPMPVSAAHACLAELFLCITVWMAFATSRTALQASAAEGTRRNPLRIPALVFWLAVFLQILVGAVMRHSYAGLSIPTFPLAFGAAVPPFWGFGIAVNFLHTRVGALVLLTLGLGLAGRALTTRQPPLVKALASGLAFLLLAQCGLGMLTVWSGKAPVPASFHLALGALVFASALLIFLAVRIPMPVPEAREPRVPRVHKAGDMASPLSSFVELMKLRMVGHILITAFVGYYLGRPADMGWAGLWETLLGTAVLAVGAFALNQALEKDFDRRMPRTAGRPVPTERVGQRTAFAFGVLCFLAGTGLLWIRVNALTGFLGGLTIVLYAAVYTPLKRYSSLNTLVGAVPGALPPLMGWTAAQNQVGLGGLLLFAILFFWQLPHFLALAWMYKSDYRQGGFKMLSVTDPTGEALFRHAVLQTLILTLVSLFPFLFRLAGNWYLLCALIGGGYFLLSAVSLSRLQTREAARNLFLTSLVYLPVLLLVMALDKAMLFV